MKAGQIYINDVAVPLEQVGTFTRFKVSILNMRIKKVSRTIQTERL